MERLFEVIKIAQQYEKLYNILKNLEKEKSTQSDEYKYYADFLKVYNQVLLKEFRKLKLNYDDLNVLDEKITALYNLKNSNITLEFLDLKETQFYKKVYSIMIDYMLSNHISTLDKKIENKEEKLSLINYFINPEKEKEYNMALRKSIEIEDNIILTRQNYFNCVFIKNLIELINNEENEVIKNILIDAKYNFIFLCNNLSSLFSKNQNNFDDSYRLEELISITYLEYDNYYDQLYDLPNLNLARMCFKKLIKLGNYDYKNPEIIAKTILIQTYIKSLLEITQNISYRQKIINIGLEQSERIKSTSTRLSLINAISEEEKLKIYQL